MKTDTPPRPGVIDALSAGLSLARRRPWLIVIPAILDFALWLAPRLSIAPLVQRLMQSWDLLVQTTYSPDQILALEPVLRQWHERADLVSAQANLFDGITGGWLGAPSLVSNSQLTRLSFISDLVLGPINLAAFPRRGLPLEISTFGGLLLAAIGLWLIGQVIVAFYLRLASNASLASGSEQPLRRHSLLGLAARIALFGILVGIIVSVLESLLSLALMLVNVSGSSPLAIVALMFAGVVLWLTLWFLLALFFVNEGLVLEGRPVLRSMIQSIRLVNANLGRALGLIAIINLLFYGFRVVWGLVGVTPLGAGLAILGNAYLSASMLLAAFAFFGDLRKAAVVAQAKAVN